VIAADTSVAVAAFASWHDLHAVARRALPRNARLVAHCAIETFSVLTRLPIPHRAPGALVERFLEAQFPGAHLALDQREQRGLLRRLVELGISGGAAYDALIAITAESSGATLLTCDRRALPIYERCGASFRLVG
jgi:predicted nucleic acid-binding protein